MSEGTDPHEVIARIERNEEDDAPQGEKRGSKDHIRKRMRKRQRHRRRRGQGKRTGKGG